MARKTLYTSSKSTKAKVAATPAPAPEPPSDPETGLEGEASDIRKGRNDRNDPFAERSREFARRLNTAMMRRGWGQSEMARHAQAVAAPGVVVDRQKIHSYIRRAHLPNQLALNAIAKALNMAPEDLIPTSQAEFLGSPYQLLASGNRAQIKLEMSMTLEDAMKIVAIAQKYE